MDNVNKELSNMDSYIEKMNNSMLDKMWFLGMPEICNANILFDYGCADGKLIKSVIDNPLNTFSYYFGYDIDSNMINRASRDSKKDVEVYTDSLFEFISLTRNIHNDNSLLCLSSVVHEIFSYMDNESATNLINKLFSCGFKYIAIRDMYCGNKIKPTNEQLEKLSILPSSILRQYGMFFKDITNPQWYAQFLLKYFYYENWEKEVKENYFEGMNNIFKKLCYDGDSQYKIIHRKEYCLPYLTMKWLNDFGIDMRNCTTHINLLLERI